MGWMDKLKSAGQGVSLVQGVYGMGKGVKEMVTGEFAKGMNDFESGIVHLAVGAIPGKSAITGIADAGLREYAEHKKGSPLTADERENWKFEKVATEGADFLLKKGGNALGDGAYNLTHADSEAKLREDLKKRGVKFETPEEMAKHKAEPPVRMGTTTVEHVGRPTVTPGDPVGTITLPEVKIETTKAQAARENFKEDMAKYKAMDPKAIIVDGIVKPPSQAVNLEGKPTHVGHNDKTGLTTIDFTDKRGHHRAVSFKDPMGVDDHGQPMPHPLHEMATKLQEHNRDYDQMKLVRDGKGNTDFSVGNAIVKETGHDGPGVPQNLSVPSRGQQLAGAGMGL